MGRNGMFGSFQGFDAFGKTMEDVKIKTRTGALLTFISLSIILTSVMLEFIDYRRIHLEPSIIVDRSRGEKLVIDFDIEFPRVPCYLLSLDVMDISGEHQTEFEHQVTKTRMNKDGNVISKVQGSQLKGDVERANLNQDPNYCGSCYGAPPPESGCCNSCEEVRQAYGRKGWSFSDPEGIEQCVEEGWMDKMKEQNEEGCRIDGHIRVNKVIGNLHFSPGRSFQNNMMQMLELVPYLRDKNHHDFGHIVHKFRFGGDMTKAEELTVLPKEQRWRDKLGLRDPLQGMKAHTEVSNYMFQYFLKVVSTNFISLNGEEIPSHQYSVTQYERDLRTGNAPGKDAHGHMTSHGMMGVPGVFFNYEISPMKVIHTEERQSFAHFLTSTCAIVGGVLTVASLVDSFIFSSSKRLKKKSEDSFRGPSGKIL
ncbi:COPII-coated vesicle component Erv46 [Cryptococcus neoformans]|uniref:COPII-coated vesicle component Erv46 n=2 Tax=Cryptococcus neoformans TaxID=5207 RepID=A0A854Q6C3_CRYNE|nr:COPII-coated vesicle component Erv46 [Cryptococcus neoformans var. grubii H99]AUB27908.1 COPII-coated vesicle component Erv46 [Cryptococcus neoformans var. grubii]OWT36334.1 COPII-coated vesicle component Erv46 [Cryptococcus neoformans var. grubii Bt1]OWZ27606.1 COPII-coated vesicle component Erv46 [Cryptococcus neoformans var. grubii AD2-60a]OWZ32721.1 COPII-coated vesicle component Erv46 [Cryptococcus neoformans var. grubii AD1-83a]OWZ39910.1 COPII-coated vesicle component Erv46 [Cryptoco|eukprot:XP_012052655.1 COPII-coated vesicle component Erv46 [Cryptococcus neoformans var. grubii H99]